MQWDCQDDKSIPTNIQLVFLSFASNSCDAVEWRNTGTTGSVSLCATLDFYPTLASTDTLRFRTDKESWETDKWKRLGLETERKKRSYRLT